LSKYAREGVRMGLCYHDTGFEREDRPAGRTLLVSGEIDLVTAPRFRAQLEALIAEAHSPAFVDLSGVTFFDSSGLAALLAARRAAERTDVTLVLVNPSPLTERVLEITGVDELFEICDDPTSGWR
jgi:anti-anti-sigma factor